MQNQFPDALIACIRDGRLPMPEEIISMSNKLREEGRLGDGPSCSKLAKTFAKVALNGARMN